MDAPLLGAPQCGGFLRARDIGVHSESVAGGIRHWWGLTTREEFRDSPASRRGLQQLSLPGALLTLVASSDSATRWWEAAWLLVCGGLLFIPAVLLRSKYGRVAGVGAEALAVSAFVALYALVVMVACGQEHPGAELQWVGVLGFLGFHSSVVASLWLAFVVLSAIAGGGGAVASVGFGLVALAALVEYQSAELVDQLCRSRQTMEALRRDVVAGGLDGGSLETGPSPGAEGAAAAVPEPGPPRLSTASLENLVLAASSEESVERDIESQEVRMDVREAEATSPDVRMWQPSDSEEETVDPAISEAVRLVKQAFVENQGLDSEAQLVALAGSLQGPCQRSERLRGILELHGWAGTRFAGPPEDPTSLLAALMAAKKECSVSAHRASPPRPRRRPPASAAGAASSPTGQPTCDASVATDDEMGQQCGVGPLRSGLSTSSTDCVRSGKEDKGTETWIVWERDGFVCRRCAKPPALKQHMPMPFARPPLAGTRMSSGSSSSGLRRTRRTEGGRSGTGGASSPPPPGATGTLSSAQTTTMGSSYGDSEGYEGSVGAGQGFHGGYQVTKAHSAAISLLFTMKHWNLPRAPRGCCPFHAGVMMAKGLIKRVHKDPCNPLWSPLSGWQCQVCTCMNHESVPRCDMCGGVPNVPALPGIEEDPGNVSPSSSSTTGGGGGSTHDGTEAQDDPDREAHQNLPCGHPADAPREGCPGCQAHSARQRRRAEDRKKPPAPAATLPPPAASGSRPAPPPQGRPPRAPSLPRVGTACCLYDVPPEEGRILLQL